MERGLSTLWGVAVHPQGVCMGVPVLGRRKRPPSLVCRAPRCKMAPVTSPHITSAHFAGLWSTRRQPPPPMAYSARYGTALAWAS
jgi:hypothetical protein